ncbi:MAG: hypothetical protein P0S93_03430 [Candidatus Neptunochlamydia sp.]|nr:hypothetical protein [Candidatus Neptunochlamydia sp.]
MKKEDPVIPPFIDSVQEILECTQLHILEKKLVVADLSRSAHIGYHVAAAYRTISTILDFSPLTQFRAARTS